MLTTILLFAGFMYFVAPLFVLATQRQAANPQFQPYGTTLQDSRFRFLTDSAARIQNLGFELVGYFGLIGYTTNVTLFLAYLIHRQNGDGALVVMVQSNAGTSTQLVEYSTRFVDQGSLTTGNSRTQGVYFRPRQKPVYHFPWINDPARLYNLHQQLIQRDKPGMQKEYVKPGAEIERLCDGMRREMAEQLQPGILRLDKSGEWYRPTLKGAYLMSWKLLPPCKQIRSALRNSSRRRIEKALAGPTVTPVPISPS